MYFYLRCKKSLQKPWNWSQFHWKIRILFCNLIKGVDTGQLHDFSAFAVSCTVQYMCLQCCGVHTQFQRENMLTRELVPSKLSVEKEKKKTEKVAHTPALALTSGLDWWAIEAFVRAASLERRGLLWFGNKAWRLFLIVSRHRTWTLFWYCTGGQKINGKSFDFYVVFRRQWLSWTHA